MGAKFLAYMSRLDIVVYIVVKNVELLSSKRTQDSPIRGSVSVLHPHSSSIIHSTA